MGGINKHKLKLRFKRLYRLKTWQLIAILIPLSFISATLLRFDHLKMVALRDAVLTADQEDDDQKIATALTALREFTFSHIVINIVEANGRQTITFGTGVFYLERQYLRAASTALKTAEARFSAAASGPKENIYLSASNVCRARAIASGWTWDNPNYINCMTSEIGKHPASANLKDQNIADLPSTELYRKSYASPLFSPTPSGFVILLILLIVVVIFTRSIIWLILRLSLLIL